MYYTLCYASHLILASFENLSFCGYYPADKRPYLGLFSKSNLNEEGQRRTRIKQIAKVNNLKDEKKEVKRRLLKVPLIKKFLISVSNFVVCVDR